MEFSDSLRSSARNFLNRRSICEAANHSYTRCIGDKFAIGYIEVDRTDPIIEIPCFCSSLFASHIINRLSTINKEPVTSIRVCVPRDCDNDINKYICYIFSSIRSKAISGGEAILKFCRRDYDYAGFVKVFTPKGYVYHCAPGCILDKDYNPILTTTIRHTVVNNTSLKVKDYKVYISNSVFIDQDDPVNKVIIKKLIPYYLTELTSTLEWGSGDVPVDICVGQSYQGFKKCNSKVAATVTSNDINETLLSNIDKILPSLYPLIEKW